MRDRGAELLHRNAGVHRYARGGSTMGIPLLHPWANLHLPNVARERWQVELPAMRRLELDARALL